jgi:AcrR family transcriptional regulator
MQERAEKTKSDILSAAKKEFLRFGFSGASLRRIASDANVTTGAIYGFFSDKNAVFSELVDGFISGVNAMYESMEKQYYDGLEDGIVNVIDLLSTNSITVFLDYIYNNFDAASLLFKHSDGSGYSGYIHSLIERETEVNLNFLETIKRRFNSDYYIDENFVHVISSMSFNTIAEMIVHEVPKDEAKRCLLQSTEFYISGWKNLFNKIKAFGSA